MASKSIPDENGWTVHWTKLLLDDVLMDEMVIPDCADKKYNLAS